MGLDQTMAVSGADSSSETNDEGASGVNQIEESHLTVEVGLSPRRKNLMGRWVWKERRSREWERSLPLEETTTETLNNALNLSHRTLTNSIA